jgi:hypothetical protein
MIDESAIRLRYEALVSVLDERGRRRFAAAEALAAGRGGVSAVSMITGIARSTINRGLVELRGAPEESSASSRVRRAGGGRKRATEKDPTLLPDLHMLVEPVTRGDPMTPLLWTAKSLRNLADGLRELGHGVCHNVVAGLLREMGYSLQGNRKTLEGGSHPDRDAQFRYINDQVKSAFASEQPVISVDTKKKELVGDFKNAGREYRPEGQPEEVRVHDFVIPELGRASPYGVYDIAENAGWVSVGIDHDTASFAVNSIRRWWNVMGRQRYPEAKTLVITADGVLRQAQNEGQQRQPGPTLEARIADARQRTRNRDHCPSSAARHEQMEQDRAPPVLVHHPKLARTAPRQLSHHRATHRRHHHRNRFESEVRDRRQHLSEGRQSRR